MRPRRQRWVSIPEVLDSLHKTYPTFAAKLSGKPRKRQLETVRRMVRRAERRDACRFTKRVDGDVYVSVDALEALLPVDVETVAVVEKGLVDLHQSHRVLQRQVNGHGAKLRDHGKRLGSIEEIQRHLADAQLSTAKATALLTRA